jgi:hypothetical protein
MVAVLGLWSHGDQGQSTYNYPVMVVSCILPLASILGVAKLPQHVSVMRPDALNVALMIWLTVVMLLTPDGFLLWSNCANYISARLTVSL